jgi:hypothetical protein
MLERARTPQTNKQLMSKETEDTPTSEGRYAEPNCRDEEEPPAARQKWQGRRSARCDHDLAFCSSYYCIIVGVGHFCRITKCEQ